VTFRWQEDVDLSAANTLRLPCRARVLAVAGDDAALLEVFARADAAGLPVHVLGGGSNVVLPPYIDGVVLMLEEQAPPPLAPGEVLVAGGCDWDAVVRASAAAGLWGLENLALIPGRVGAAPVQNIGAYGRELADVCVAVRALDRSAGHIVDLPAAECRFGYRDSRFRREAGRWVITAVTLRLAARGSPLLEYPSLREACANARLDGPLAVAEQVSDLRRARLPDPASRPNAGSFFKNPVLTWAAWERLHAQEPDCPGRAEGEGVKVPAAWLIERAGWRGRSRDGLGVARAHALVLIHEGGSDGVALLAFAGEIVADVEARFDVRLEREPVLLGWTEAPPGGDASS
jgi:UDP-N-acetylmuramate dehydrogenase